MSRPAGLRAELVSAAMGAPCAAPASPSSRLWSPARDDAGCRPQLGTAALPAQEWRLSRRASLQATCSCSRRPPRPHPLAAAAGHHSDLAAAAVLAVAARAIQALAGSADPLHQLPPRLPPLCDNGSFNVVGVLSRPRQQILSGACLMIWTHPVFHSGHDASSCVVLGCRMAVICASPSNPELLPASSPATSLTTAAGLAVASCTMHAVVDLAGHLLQLPPRLPLPHDDGSFTAVGVLSRPRLQVLSGLSIKSIWTGEFVSHGCGRPEELSAPQDWRWRGKQEEMVVACSGCCCRPSSSGHLPKMLPCGDVSGLAAKHAAAATCVLLEYCDLLCNFAILRS